MDSYFEVFAHDMGGSECIAKFQYINGALVLMQALNAEIKRLGLEEQLNYTMRTVTHIMEDEDIGYLYGRQVHRIAEFMEAQDAVGQ